MLKRARLEEGSPAVHVTKAMARFLDELYEKHSIRAFIGGGLPRDLYCGQKPKDIDLYVRRTDFGNAHNLLFNKTVDWEEAPQETDGPAYQHQSIELAVEDQMNSPAFETQFKLPINLIGIKRDAWDERARLDKIAEETIGKYDFGMCMATILPSGLWVNDKFLQDVQNKQCTLYRSFGREYAVAHYNRIKKKYPWPMVDILDDEIPF